MTRAIIFPLLVVPLLSFAVVAGELPDADLDGVPDNEDNCIYVANGPLLAKGSCDDQQDGDQDGYGNPCDSDFNQNGATDLADLSDMLSAVINVSTDPVFDLDCDGAASTAELHEVLQNVWYSLLPGPSGLACAGTIPCP